MTDSTTQEPQGDWLSTLHDSLRDSVHPNELRGPVSVGGASKIARNSLNTARWKKFLDGGYSAGIFEGID